MKHELRKIWKDRRLCLLFAAVVFLNLLLFYWHCTDDSRGYSMEQLRGLYGNADVLEEEQAHLEEALVQCLYGLSDDDVQEIMGQMERNQAALDRIRQARDYQELRESLVSGSELKLKLGLFGSNDSFEARSLRRGIEVYQALSGVRPEAVFLGGVELLMDYRLTDLLLLLFCAAAGLTLFTFEKGSGLQTLTQPTKNGHGPLFFRKLGASVGLLTMGFLLLYGGNILTAGLLFGFDHLRCPAQSLFGFANCPAEISVLGLLIRVFALKYLWALACLGIGILISASTGTAAVAVIEMVMAGAAAYWMGGSHSLWIRHLSLSWLAGTENQYEGAVYLNLFGIPVGSVTAAIVFLMALCGISLGVAAVLYCVTQDSQRRSIGSLSGIFPARHTGVFRHECRKALLMWKGLAVLLAFVAVQVVSYQSYPANNSEYEYYYRSYSEALAGLPNAEKDAYLQREQDRITALNEKLLEYASQYPDPDTFQRVSQDTQNALRVQDAFHQAKDQYDSLRPGQSYLYQTGYQRIVGTETLREEVQDWAKAFLAMTILLSGFHAAERECGALALQTAARKSRTVLRSKFWICAGYAVAVTLIAFLPRLTAVFRTYGGWIASASANSISGLSALPDGWSVGVFFAAMLLGKLLVVGIVGRVVCWISKRSPNTMIALLLSAAALMIPVAAVLLTL